MRNALVLSTGILITSIFMGCNRQGRIPYASPAEPMVEQIIASLDDLTEVFRSVKDQDSAAAAAPRLRKIVESMAELQERVDDIRLSKEQDEQLRRKYEPRIQAATARLLNESMRLAELTGNDAFKTFAEKLRDSSSPNTKPRG
jgi:hypothetical protein